VKYASNIVAREGGHTRPYLVLKPSKIEDDEWNNIDFHTKATIILCLSDEVLYNIINEEITADL